MAVTRSDGDAQKERTRWDNLTKQKVRLELNHDGTQNGGSSTVEDFFTIDPAGGVDRGKIQELVRMRLFATARPRSQGAADASGWVVYEVTTDPESSYVDPNDAESTDDVEGITGLNRDVWQDDEDPGTLDIFRLNYQGSWDDDTNGNGGSAQVTEYEHSVGFRDEYGITGPLFDTHDRINVHLRAFANSDMAVDADLFMSLDWLEWQVEEDLDDRLRPC